MNKVRQALLTALILKMKSEAEKIFESYPDLEDVYITSDLQGFKELDKAENHAQCLSVKLIKHFKRGENFSVKDEIDALLADGDNTPNEGEDKAQEDTKEQDNEPSEENEKASSEAPIPVEGETPTDVTEIAPEDNLNERQELLLEYEELYGKKAPQKIGIEKLKKLISEKK